MAKYIDKSALVAAIEKRYEYWREKEHNSHSVESEIRMSECQHLMLLLNTLEVKEVDLEKEEYQISQSFEGEGLFDGSKVVLKAQKGESV